ncbi:hypothetical protein, partial [Pseudomonas sp. PS01300]
ALPANKALRYPVLRSACFAGKAGSCKGETPEFAGALLTQAGKCLLSRKFLLDFVENLFDRSSIRS